MTGARWVVFAYHSFGARALEALVGADERVVAVVTHPDDPREGDWFESVAEVARIRRLPLVTVDSPNTALLRDMLARFEPDVLLSVWFRRLLGPDVLALPRIAALNLHGSLLPAYRGRAPLNWVLVHGETRTGVTLHHMTLEADAGDIVAQQPIDIEPDDTAITLYRRMIKVGVPLLLDWAPAVVEGTAPRIPQDPSQASSFGRRRPEDGRVSWRWPARRIADMVRAVTHPFPGAFVGDGARRLYLWAAAIDAEIGGGGRPGAIVEIRPARGVVVEAGEGRLLLTSVQDAGVVGEPADVWALRRGVRPGTVLEETS